RQSPILHYRPSASGANPLLPRRLGPAVRVLEAAVGGEGNLAPGLIGSGRVGPVEVGRRIPPGDVAREEKAPAGGGRQGAGQPPDELRLLLRARSVLGRGGVADFRKRDRPVPRGLEEPVPVQLERLGRPVPERLLPNEGRVEKEEDWARPVELRRDLRRHAVPRRRGRDADGDAGGGLLEERHLPGAQPAG